MPRLPVPPAAGDTRRVTRVVAASLRLHRRRRCLSFVRSLSRRRIDFPISNETATADGTATATADGTGTGF